MPNTYKTKRSMFTHFSIAQIVTVVVTALVLLIGICILLLFINLYKASIERNTLLNSSQTVERLKNSLNNYMIPGKDVMDSVKQKLEVSTDFDDDYFNGLINARKDIVSLTMYDHDGRLLKGMAKDHTIKESYVMVDQGVYNDPSEVVKMTTPRVASMFTDYYPWVITYYQQIAYQNGEMVLVSIDMDFAFVADYINKIGMGRHGFCFIIDKLGDVIYHPQQQLINAGLKSIPSEVIRTIVQSPESSIKANGVIYSTSEVTDEGWIIIGASYINEMITENVKTMSSVAIILLYLVFMLAISLGFLFGKIFTNPINRLVRAIRVFEKNTQKFKYSPVSGSREIMHISESFGQMVVQIQNLVEKVKDEGITLRKTELKALQAQINPHFLYNTLDSITWMCEDGKTAEAVEMVNALAHLFRISISKGNELITLKKELEHAQSYLKIQNIRYKDRFTYTFVIDEECLCYYCNKITLQPLIENAIYHGIEPMVDEGEIKIIIQQRDDKLQLIVSDNGIGMSEEQCQLILSSERLGKSGIGVKNVNDRIQIYFGEHYGIDIKSELDVGTTICVTIPKLEEVDYEKIKT